MQSCEQSEVTNSIRAEVTNDRERWSGTDANGCLQGSNGFRQPTAAEVSGLPFGQLPDNRIRPQELSNLFARLLNRGSSLE